MARITLKRLLQTICLALVFPSVLLSGFGRFFPLYELFAHAWAMAPGFPGSFLRTAFYRLTLRDCSLDVVIGFGSYFSRTSAAIGPNVSIGAYCVIGEVSIGARTQIASHVEIPSGRRQHLRTAAGLLGDAIDDRVVIGSDCWIGSSAVILAGVGDRATIGAGSIVVKAIPAGATAVGNPAKVIRTAESSTYELA